MAHEQGVPRVLVVDDEESVRRFAEAALRQARYEVAVASEGSEALRMAEEQGPFDLILADLVMREMRGDELARQVRRLYPDMKVLYFTGYSDRLFEERKVLWEKEAFIDKPVSMKGLLDAVSLILFGHTRGLLR